MNNWKLWVAIGCMCCAPAARVQARTPEAHAVRIGSIEELQAYFTYSPDRDIVVSGHRGGMMAGYPENCIESCEKTLSLLPTFFEIDFSFTKDSIPVLMHDLTIDRTTTGKGRVSDYTFDNKYVNTKGVSDRVRRASIDYYIRQLQPGGDWAEYHNIVLSVRSLDEALRYWNSGIRQVMFCVEISSRADFEAYDASPIPWRYIMAYIRTAVDPRLQEVYDLLHARGVMTMTSIVETSDKVKNARDRNTAYLRELLAEPDIIETDYPSEFVELPRSRREIHALQDCALRSRSRK